VPPIEVKETEFIGWNPLKAFRDSLKSHPGHRKKELGGDL
jgi:hypothetical protein